MPTFLFVCFLWVTAESVTHDGQAQHRMIIQFIDIIHDYISSDSIHFLRPREATECFNVAPTVATTSLERQGWIVNKDKHHVSRRRCPSPLAVHSPPIANAHHVFLTLPSCLTCFRFVSYSSSIFRMGIVQQSVSRRDDSDASSCTFVTVKLRWRFTMVSSFVPSVAIPAEAY